MDTKKLRKELKEFVAIFTIVISSICMAKTTPGNSLTENVKLHGMRIDNLDVNGKIATLTTTGGVFHIDLEKGVIVIKQRIGKERTLAKIAMGKGCYEGLSSPTLNGFDCIWKKPLGNGFKIVISGDSTIQFYNIERVQIKLFFTPIYDKINSSCGGLMALDNDGGLVIAPPKLSARSNWPKTFEKNSWNLSASEPLSLLFIGVCPPRHFDWNASFNYNVHYSSHTQRYPTDEEIVKYSKYAKVLEMHSWVWQNRYDPKAIDADGNKFSKWYDFSSRSQNYKWIPEDEVELRRVVKTAHAHGLKVVPYINFLREEYKYSADRDVIDRWMSELKKLKEKYDFDGFYVDGLYPLDPELSYMTARALRGLVGNDGWLTLHDTRSNGYFFPFVNAYMDFIVTSEHSLFNRWNSTSYRISNTVASVWPEISMDIEDGREFLKELIDNSLRYNNRLVLMDGKDGQWRLWRLYFTDDEMKFVQEYLFSNMERMKSKYISEGAVTLNNKNLEVTPQSVTEINFADEILFWGYDLKQTSIKNSGVDCLVTFYFKLLKPVAENRDVYLHINNVVAQESIINTNMKFTEGKPHYWEQNQFVSKAYSFFVPTEKSLEDYHIKVGLWDHDRVLGNFEIENISSSISKPEITNGYK